MPDKPIRNNLGQVVGVMKGPVEKGGWGQVEVGNPFKAPWVMENPSEIRRLLSDLDTPSDAPTEWEMDFINSITNQLEHGRVLSEKQVACLRKIHARIG